MATLGNVTFYADDPVALSHFWAGVFGYPPATFEGELKAQLLASGLTEDDLSKRGLAQDPTGEGPRLFFHHADSPKSARNRIHLDISATPGRYPTPEELDAEKDRIVALGATVVLKYDADWGGIRELHYVMQDPEGNEFCIQ